MNRVASTPYIEWAKLKSATTWNLAVSGLPHASWEDLGGHPQSMPIAGSTGYGYAPLLERIAGRYRVQPSQVVTATGCSMATFLALATLVEPGDEVLIERPTYEPIRLAALHLGATVTRFDREPTRDFRVDADRVIAAMTPRTKVIVMANLHNPSSQGVDHATLVAIGNAAERVGALVLIDEVYLDAVFDDTPASSVHLGPAFVATSSLTKVYGLAAFRCGWILADAAVATRAWRLADLYGNSQPFAPDWLSTVAFDRLDILRARSRALVDANRGMFREWAATRTDLEFTWPDWGTTVCVRPIGRNALEFCETLRARHEVAVVPGHFFELPEYFRLSLCTDTVILREGLARIARCLDTAD